MKLGSNIVKCKGKSHEHNNTTFTSLALLEKRLGNFKPGAKCIHAKS